MRVIIFVLILSVVAVSCKNTPSKKSDSKILEAISKDTKTAEEKCEFVFGAEPAIRCAKVADKISGYDGDWPEGTNSTLFFQLLANNKILTEIDFCFIRIDSLPSSIGQVSNLEILRLTGGTIKRIPKAIGNLKKLHTLVLGDSKTECGGNPVQFISPEIGNCSSLEYLGLAFSEVTDLPTELLKCSNLKTIDLFKNEKIDLKKLKELKERFKGIEIISHLN